jgi:hypothetical protein
MMESRMMNCDQAASMAPKRVCKQVCKQPCKQAWMPIKQVALAGALGLLAAAGLSPDVARAQDSSGDGTLFGSVLKGLGIGGENNIEYRERPPLVVPPTRNLPPPQPAGAARNPNWPVDPKSADVQQKKGNQVRDLDRLPVPQRPAVPSVAVTTPANPSASGPDGTPAPPSEPGLFGKLFSSTDMPANAVIPVPTRKNLTDPPLDYESPSTAQPYGEAAPAAPAKATPESALQAGQPAARPGGL